MPYYYKRQEHENVIEITRRCYNCDSHVRSYYTVCPNCNEDISQPCDCKSQDNGNIDEQT